jgi:hypothetical protein
MRTSTGDGRLTSANSILRDERNVTKVIAVALGCSKAQADRIVKSGHAPADLREKFIFFLKALRNKRMERVHALDQEIFFLEIQASVEASHKAAQSENGGAP